MHHSPFRFPVSSLFFCFSRFFVSSLLNLLSSFFFLRSAIFLLLSSFSCLISSYFVFSLSSFVPLLSHSSFFFFLPSSVSFLFSVRWRGGSPEFCGMRYPAATYSATGSRPSGVEIQCARGALFASATSCARERDRESSARARNQPHTCFPFFFYAPFPGFCLSSALYSRFTP